MERFPLRRGTAFIAPVAALAMGGAMIMPGHSAPKPTPEQSYSAADGFTDLDEQHEIRQQLLGVHETEAAHERAAEHARASRSRRATDIRRRSHHQVRLTHVAANLMQDIDALGGCESGNKPDTNTGNGYFGEFQFDMTTWRSNGYTKYASRPDLASESEQIAATIDLHSKRGWEPWPTCARKLGLFTHHYAQTG